MLVKLNDEFPKPLKIDDKAPEMLEVIIRDKKTGKELFFGTAPQKHFKTGSMGYHIGGKLENPENGERYQVGCNITLIGSKP